MIRVTNERPAAFNWRPELRAYALFGLSPDGTVLNMGYIQYTAYLHQWEFNAPSTCLLGPKCTRAIADKLEQLMLTKPNGPSKQKG